MQQIYAKDLNPAAKEVARLNIIQIELNVYSEMLDTIRTSLKLQSIHTLVNLNFSSYRSTDITIRKAFRQYRFITRLKNDRKYYDKVVDENLCVFNEEGHFFSFEDKKFKNFVN